jgi:hypothetical protein
VYAKGSRAAVDRAALAFTHTRAKDEAESNAVR